MKDEDLIKTLTILYVEDDRFIRTMLERFLARRVTTVYSAQHGEEGLKVYETNGEAIDVVITDIEMPVMDGMEMIRRILEIDFNQPVIITTAYNDELHTSNTVCKNIIKPINTQEVLDSIVYCIKKHT